VLYADALSTEGETGGRWGAVSGVHDRHGLVCGGKRGKSMPVGHAVQGNQDLERGRPTGRTRRDLQQHRTGGVSARRGSPVCDPVTVAYEDRMHEVRGSLAALAGALRALADDGAPLATESRQRIGALANAELDRLSRLVAPPDVETASESQELDLDDVVEHVVASRRLAGQAISWHPTGHRVTGRADEVTQILNILLVNAARHAPGAPAHVDVVRDGSTLRVRVSDDGPGVPDELRGDIFSRGRRSNTTGGQGIGLALARSLAHGLGGSLALSDIGHGASFEMTLPFHHLGGAA
jgi:signal transduction histidine kinase